MTVPPPLSKCCIEWAAWRLGTPELVDDATELFAQRATRDGIRLARRWYRRQARACLVAVCFKSLRRAGSGPRSDPRGVGPILRRRRAISWLDVKLGLRMLIKYPMMTVVGGFAISTTVAIALLGFGVFQDYFRPALTLPEGERIVSLRVWRTDENEAERRVLREFASWREGLESVQDLGLWRDVSQNLLTSDGRGVSVEVVVMSASGFDVAGIPPLLGRPLQSADEQRGAEPVLVIGHDQWMSQFDADPEVVGRTVQLGYTRRTIVGVMPKGFGFPYSHSYWIPLVADPYEFGLFEGPGFDAFGRLAPGVSRSQAGAEIVAHTDARARLAPDSYSNLTAQVLRYTDPYTAIAGGENAPFARGVLTVLTLLVLIPFANVGILVYARTATRAGEIAVRGALGASRTRIVLQLFTEAMVLSTGAALIGVGLNAYAWIHIERLLRVYGGIGLPFWAQHGMNGSAALYVAAITALAAVVAGVVPGVQATGRRAYERMKRSGGGAGIRLGPVWTALVVTQVAITVAFIPFVGWVAWDAFGQGTARASFPVDDLLGVDITAARPSAQVREIDRTQTIAEVARRVEAMPGVTGVILSDRLPDELFSVSLYAFSRIDIDGIEPPAGEPNHRVGSTLVEPGFFEFLGIPVEQGREFTTADVGVEPSPVVVNEAFVQQQLGDTNAIGRLIRAYRPPDEEPAPWREIVGVVSELAENPLRPDAHQGRIFGPFGRVELESAFLTVRVPTDPAGMIPEVERIAMDVDPGMSIARAAPLTAERNPIRAGMRMAASGLGLMLASVFLLCSAGVFALMSFNVTQRRREIGVRTALGASSKRVMTQVTARSVRQLSIGAAIGLAIVSRTRPFSIDGLPVDRDPKLTLFFAALMISIGAVAAVVPARRGLRVPPADALRAE